MTMLYAIIQDFSSMIFALAAGLTGSCMEEPEKKNKIWEGLFLETFFTLLFNGEHVNNSYLMFIGYSSSVA